EGNGMKARNLKLIVAGVFLLFLCIAVGTVGAAGTPPTVTGVTPSEGYVGGGNTIAITGTGFTGATAVHFNTTLAVTWTLNSDTLITAIVPSTSAGVPADVTVTNPYGTSAVNQPADEYYYNTYQGPQTPQVPTINTPIYPGNSVSGTAPYAQGLAIDLKVANKGGTTYSTGVNQDGTWNMPGLPALVPGDTIVAYGYLTTHPIQTDYPSNVVTATVSAVPLPVVTSISPAIGSTIGGTSVTITGSGFTGATAVDFGTIPATDVIVVNDNTITATTPA